MPTKRVLPWILLFVATLCIGITLYLNRDPLHRWWLMRRLQNDDSAKLAWRRLQELSNVSPANPSPLGAFSVWPQGQGGVNLGWLWVHDQSQLRVIKPDGTVLPTALALGEKPTPVFNGNLPNGRPGLVLFTDGRISSGASNDGYLIGLSVADEGPGGGMPYMRFYVQVNEPATTVKFVYESAVPWFELSTSNGALVAKIAFGEQLVQESDETDVKPSPWKLRFSE